MLGIPLCPIHLAKYSMNLDDLDIYVGCAAAHPDRRGGQHVAMQCSTVHVVHKPTGIGVRVDSERSQFKNKEIAMKRLEALLTLEADLEEALSLLSEHEDYPHGGNRHANKEQMCYPLRGPNGDVRYCSGPVSFMQ